MTRAEGFSFVSATSKLGVMSYKKILMLGSILGTLAVILGAFGAHGLESSIKEWGLSADEETKRLHNWEVAVRYHMYHALALLAVAMMAAHRPSKALSWSAVLFTVGVLIFSGCLYAYALSGVRFLGAIVPIGGSCLIGGWVLLTIVAACLPTVTHER